VCVGGGVVWVGGGVVWVGGGVVWVVGGVVWVVGGHVTGQSVLQVAHRKAKLISSFFIENPFATRS
jgi:hypothetical protein